LVGKPEEKKPIGRHNIMMDLRVTEWGGMDWPDLVQDRDK
jgi:hypothetical protein